MTLSMTSILALSHHPPWSWPRTSFVFLPWIRLPRPLSQDSHRELRSLLLLTLLSPQQTAARGGPHMSLIHRRISLSLWKIEWRDRRHGSAPWTFLNMTLGLRGRTGLGRCAKGSRCDHEHRWIDDGDFVAGIVDERAGKGWGGEIWQSADL